MLSFIEVSSLKKSTVTMRPPMTITGRCDRREIQKAIRFSRCPISKSASGKV